MDFEDDEGYQEPEGWSSSDEDELDGDATVLAVTPYSRIVAYPPPASIARKRLSPGHRPPHNPNRELAILQYLKEKQQSETSTRYVIELLSSQLFPSGKITLDFPLMQTDLKEIYRQRKEEIAHSPTELDLIIRRFLEILTALEFVHSNGIIHRDVNPANILLSNDLRQPAYLSDFGIAWKDGYPDDRDEGIDKYSSGVGTGPYRAPELIFSPKDYGGEIDMWSFGCTIAELFISKDTLFTDGAQDGMLSSDLVLLASITSILGTPTSETWPETMNFRDWDKVQLSVKPPLPKKDVLPWASQGMRDWIFSMIAISAGERASASRALDQGARLIHL